MECGVNRNLMPLLACAALALSLSGAPVLAQAPAPTPITVLGQGESVHAGARSLVMKAADGSSLSVTLAEKGTVVTVESENAEAVEKIAALIEADLDA